MNGMPPVEGESFPASLWISAIDVVETGDALALLFAALLLLFVGQHAIEGHPRCKQAGTRFGLVAFVAWVARDLGLNGLWGAEQFAGTTFRGLGAAMLATAAAWIMLSLLDSFRAAVLVPAFRGPASAFRAVLQRLHTARDRRQREQEARQRQIQDERARPELERQRRCRLAEEQRQQEADRKRAEQFRRDHARFGARVVYDRYGMELNDLFPRDVFEKYLVSDLSDDHSAEDVERRADGLKQMIFDRLNLQNGKTQDDANSIKDVVLAHEEKRIELESLGLEEDLLQVLLYEIDKAEITAIREFLK